MTFSQRQNTTDSAPATFRQAGIATEFGPAAAFDLWNRLANETVQFTADRICETVKTQQQMLHCRNFAELAHLRAHWWQKTVDQYAEEAGRMSAIWAEALDRSLRVRVA